MASKPIPVANIERHNGPIMLPTKMTNEAAVEVLQRAIREDGMPYEFNEMIPAFPWDGALALRKALEERFGFAQMQSTRGGFFGMFSSPPMQIAVETGPGQTTKVPWGQFAIPGIPGYIECGHTEHDGRTIFQVHGETLNKHKPEVDALIQRIREIAAAESIYRGKAIQMRFRDDKGRIQDLPSISFLPPSDATPIFARDLERAIEANILTPMRHADMARKHGIPLKRGTLLAGPYGTGKTLLAAMIARESGKAGFTFIYVPEVAELADALDFAQAFQPAVVFAEDVERVAGTDRDEDANRLLNTLDGIGSKAGEVMTVLTSNHPESINPAMRRPGRIDLVLHVEAPDAEACERLVRLYGHGILAHGTNLAEAGMELAGLNPATVREVVERSKLEALRRSAGKACAVTGDDILATAKVLRAERDLFTPRTHNHAEHARISGRMLTGMGTALLMSAEQGANGKH